MTSPVDFSTGDIWRVAGDKSPFHSGSGARHRRVWKGLWKVYRKEYNGTYSIALLKNGIFYSISRDHKQPIKRSEFNKVLRHGYRCHGNHDVQYGRSVWALTVLNSEKTT
jgi:hypothetical protein